MNLKDRLKKLEKSKSKSFRIFYRLLKRLNHFIKLLLIEKYRSQFITAWKLGNKYYQRSFFTKTNRYPELFSQCKLYFEKTEKPRILSYGCSTGEEVLTLGEYLPNAQIMGVDINNWCLKQCKKKDKTGLFSFCHRFSSEFLKTNNFDAIFCMAVFQRTENRTDSVNIAQGLTFEEFESEVNLLDKKLNPGGLFVIDHADFSFSETSCSKNYKILDFKENGVKRKRPLFDRQNKKISDTHIIARMFVKQIIVEQ